MRLWGGLFEDKAAPRTQFERPASSGTIARVVGSSGYAYSTTNDDVGRYVQQYERVLMVWRCVDAIATACAKVPLQPRDQAGEKGRVVEDDPLLRLLNERPNTYETAFQFRYRLTTILKLSRKGAFVEVVWGEQGSVLELHILPNDKVSVVSDPSNYVRGYWVDGAHGRTFLDPTRVLWLREKPHPTQVYEQMTPLVAAGLATDTDYLARLFNRNFLANDGRPGMIVAVRGRLSPSDTARLQERYGGGPARAGETTVIQADAIELADMAGSPRDVQWMEAVAGSKQDIMLAFGTPETALGNASGRTFDNADAEMEMWWTETNTNTLDAQAAAFSAITRDGVSGRSIVAPDWDTVPVLQRQKRLRHDKLFNEFQAGLVTVDEYREGTGRNTLKTPGARAIFTAAQRVVLSTTDNVDPGEVAALPVIGMPAPPEGAMPGMPGEPGAPEALPEGPLDLDAEPPAIPEGLTGSRRNAMAARALRLAASGGELVEDAGAEVIEASAPRGEVKRASLIPAGRATYHVQNTEGRRIGTVGRVELPGVGKGWMAWDEEGRELDVWGAARYDAVSQVWRDWMGRFAKAPGTKALPPFSTKALRQPTERTRAEDELSGVVTALVAQYGKQAVGRFNGTKLRENTRYWRPAGTAPVEWSRVFGGSAAVLRFREDLSDALMRVVDRVLRDLFNEHDTRASARTMRNEIERQIVGPAVGDAAKGFERFIERMQETVTEADIESAKKDDIVGVIEQTVRDKGKSWAENTGRYLAGSAVEGTQSTFARLAADDVDLVKVWHTMDDDKVRPSHWAVDGDEADVNGMFRVGRHLMSHPHDPTAPIEERAGCRCFLTWRPRRSDDMVGMPRASRA